MRFAHLLLDLDGTLTDSRDGIVRSIAHALTTMNRTIPSAESLTRFIGSPLGRVFQDLMSTDNPEVIRAAVETYRERFASIGILENRLYPGVPETLDALENLGVTLHVVTSKPALYASRIVEHFGLARHFSSIHGPDLGDLDGDKATLISETLASEELNPAAVAMVGDRGDDIVGARANGIEAVAVTWGFGSREELNGADFIIDTPGELVAWASGG